jgi:hypothetical protein
MRVAIQASASGSNGLGRAAPIASGVLISEPTRRQATDDLCPPGRLAQNCAMNFQASGGMKALRPSSPVEVPSSTLRGPDPLVVDLVQILLDLLRAPSAGSAGISTSCGGAALDPRSRARRFRPVVASSLGHESFSTTVESYAKPEANQTGAR